MEKYEDFTGKVIPIRIRNVDTDMILPANFLTSVSRDGYGENLFRELRDKDPEFPINLDKFQGGEILVADDNFGCGSSREHAVWAIKGWGIKAVISKSFADIFSSNSGKNGLVLIRLEDDLVDSILDKAQSGEYRLQVKLETQEVIEEDGTSHSFDFDPFTKHCILNGLDDISYIKSHQEAIDAYREEAAKHLYYSTLTPNR